MPSPDLQRRQIALLVETSRAYGRELLRGVARFVREHPHWSVRLQDRGLNDPLPDWLHGSRIDGILARVETPELARSLARLRRPVINLCGTWTGTRFPVIDTDDGAVARLALDHFLDRGLRRVAYCGFPGTGWSDVRQEHFLAFARAADLEVAVFKQRHRRAGSATLAGEQAGLRQQQNLREWLAALPRPLGIFAANDLRGRQLVELCRETGAIVPDEIAVLGVDNDELLCELTDPPLSSIVPDCQRIGFEAAVQLDRWITEPAARIANQFIPPRATVTRRSTDILAMEDRHIANAVRHIREHACNGLRVADLLKVVPLSRSNLERSFRQQLGRTPKAEIIRVQLDHASRLLTQTDLTLAEIADRSGFRHPEYFSTLFKAKTGNTPGALRRKGRI
jgi:LacI family transcriptional regulator